MDFTWEEGFSISVTTDSSGAVVISANKAGLLSLANHLRTLAQEHPRSHFHLDEHNSLEENSHELIVELIE